MKRVSFFLTITLFLTTQLLQAQTVYSTNPIVGYTTPCGESNNCSNISDNPWTYMPRYFYIEVRSINGNIITLRVQKINFPALCGGRTTFPTGGFVNFRTSVCSNTNGQFNLNNSQINYITGLKKRVTCKRLIINKSQKAVFNLKHFVFN
jgi:hypothetical protein